MHECVLEFPGRLVQIQSAGTYPQSYWLCRSGMDLRSCLSSKFLDDIDASAAGPRTTLSIPLLQVLVRTRNDACPELPCYTMHKWALLSLLSCPAVSGSLLLNFHCLPPACTHPVCQPQPTTHCSLNFLCSFCPWGHYVYPCLSSKNFPVLPPTQPIPQSYFGRTSSFPRPSSNAQEVFAYLFQLVLLVFPSNTLSISSFIDSFHKYLLSVIMCHTLC